MLVSFLETSSPGLVIIIFTNAVTLPYVCKYYGKILNFSLFKAHERVHSKDRPYAYNHCGKTFSDSSSHYRHVTEVSNLMCVSIEE